MRRERGITTIGLVVTIIVMLILAGVTLSLIKGNSGIISKADESKSQTERKEVIEKAKMTISEKVVNNGGNELTRSELKEILEQYFINVPEDYTLETILKTKEENGKYEIKVSEIYDRDIMTENEETDGSTEVVPPTSSTNVENGNSGNTGTGGNTENNGDTGSSTGGTGNTNSESTSGGNSNNTGNSGNNSTEIDVTKVEMDKQTATVDINGENTVQLNAKVIPSNANKNTEITWTSKKKAVASVNQKGLVTGKTVGNSMIMATSQNGYSADCLVVCQAKITGIKINPVTANMIVGQKITLTATTSPEIVTEKVTWKSRNENVAKVDNNGRVTALKNGDATITVSTGNKKTATCKVTVVTSPTGIALDKNRATVNLSGKKTVDLTATLTPKTANIYDDLQWSSDSASAKVEKTGKYTARVTGVSNGNAKITVSTGNGYKAECIVTVETKIIGITVSPNETEVEVGSTVTLTATKKPSIGSTEGLVWSSSNNGVAKVNDDGVVTGIAQGTVTITIKSSSGLVKTTAKVTVVQSPTGITLDKNKVALDMSGTKTTKLNATIQPSNANRNTGITWNSSNTGVATVDQSGNVTAKANGMTTITATTQNGKSASCTVTVTTAITSLTVSPTSKTLKTGETVQLTATKNPSTATEGITWTSSNSSVATINQNGLVTAKGSGTATIIVKSSSGNKSATAKITVSNPVQTKTWNISKYSKTVVTEWGEHLFVGYEDWDTYDLGGSYTIDSLSGTIKIEYSSYGKEEKLCVYGAQIEAYNGSSWDVIYKRTREFGSWLTSGTNSINESIQGFKDIHDIKNDTMDAKSKTTAHNNSLTRQNKKYTKLRARLYLSDYVPESIKATGSVTLNVH